MTGSIKLKAGFADMNLDIGWRLEKQKNVASLVPFLTDGPNSSGSVLWVPAICFADCSGN